MKLQRIKKSKNKLLQLRILQLSYRKKSYNFDIDLKQIEVHLHKISDIIYKYHITDKKILFLGFPGDFNETLKMTKHTLIPKFVWFDGMLSNRNSGIDNSEKRMSKNIFRLISKLKKKLDLVVIYDLNKNSTAIKESYLTRIPVITFSEGFDILDVKTTYESIGNYSFINERPKNSSFFFSFIKTTLDRAKKTKKIKVYKSLNELKEIYKRRNRGSLKKKSWENKKAQPYKKYTRSTRKD